MSIHYFIVHFQYDRLQMQGWGCFVQQRPCHRSMTCYDDDVDDDDDVMMMMMK